MYIVRNLYGHAQKMLRKWHTLLVYASSVWDQHRIVVQEELEKVQNRAARFVTGNINFETWSMTSILEQLESIHKRRRGSKLISES